MKRIVHIQLLPILTGVQRVTLQELERLDSSEYEKYIICQSSGPLTDYAQSKGIKCIYISSLTRDISIIKDLISLVSLIKIFMKFNFDIVHTHSSKTGVLGRIAAKLCKVKCIVHTVHGFSFDSTSSKLKHALFTFLEKIGGVCSSKVICLHVHDLKIANEKLDIPLSKLIVIPNGVDISKFFPSQEKKIDTYCINVGMVGRLWKQKNPILLLDAAIDICERYPHVKFYFAGDGELKVEIEKRIKDCNLQHNIFVLGWSDNVAEFLRSLDIFVLPSLWEGMPLAILEAMSTQLPCVVSNIPGNESLVSHNTTGLLFNLPDKLNLTSAINDLINDERKRNLLAKNAYEIILKKHNINDRIIKIDAIYKSFS